MWDVMQKLKGENPLTGGLFAALLVMSPACASQASFKGAGTKEATPPPTPPHPHAAPTPAPPPPSCNGKYKVRWEGAAKDCIKDKEQIFNFGTKACTNIKPAPFECSWPSLTKELERLQFAVGDSLTKKAADGAQLVGCAQSKDEFVTIIQWYKLPAGDSKDCSFDLSQIFVQTECFEIDINADPAAGPLSNEERDKKVYECLRKAEE